MSVPKSKVLNCNKGFLAQADTSVNSPYQQTTSNVNVIVNPYEKTDLSSPPSSANYYPNVESSTDPYGSSALKSTDSTPFVPPSPDDIKERSIDTANLQLEELQSLIKDKDNLIKALNLLLDIYENNPLIINKFIVADYLSLQKLIKLLTSSKSVEIITAEQETGCTCKISNQLISKILVHKDDQVYNLKYNYPDIIQFFDKHKISYKVCV